MDCQIVAFGDSNTRYYLGDSGVCGALEEAWPAQLGDILSALGVKAVVRNEGYPGEQADFAVAEFARAAREADLCVLGFGTNDIKRLEMTMAAYLEEMGQVLDQAKAMGVRMIVLGIPWFDEHYAGAVAQSRLPKWNGALRELCDSRGVPFVDLYTPFLGAPVKWFNERETPKRHLSAAAQRRVAELVLPQVLDYIRMR